MSSYIPGALDDTVRSRAEHRCEYSRLAQAGQEATFHIDHVHPRQLGGDVHGDADGDLLVVFSEPVPRLTGTSTTIITTYVDLSTEVTTTDEFASPVLVVAEMDYDHSGYPAGTVMRVTFPMEHGVDYTVSVDAGAELSCHNWWLCETC